MSPKRIAALYYCFQLFFGLLLWVPVFYEIQKQSGLTDPEIFRIQSLYYLVFCLLELPTGMFADRFGFRTSMRLGALSLVVANLVPIATATYFGFLAHFLLIALARSFVSGASSAYLYEYLRSTNAVEEYAHIEGNARSYGLFAKIALWAFSGYMVMLHPMVPYALTALTASAATIAAFLMPDIKSVVIATTDPFRKLLDAFRILRSSPLLVVIMLQGVGIFVLVRLMEVNIFQPILVSKNFSVVHFGWILSLMTAFEAVASRRSYRLIGRPHFLKGVWLATITLCICLTVIPLAGQAGTIAAMVTFAFGAGIAFPIQKQLLNDNIKHSDMRATLLSCESLIDRAVCAVAVLPVGGFVATGHIAQLLWIFAGGCSLLVTATFLAARRLQSTK